MLHEHLFPDSAALLPVLEGFCVQALQQDLAHAQCVSCLLSGGTTPRSLYERLARADLPWQRITPALVDERFVATDAAASNEGLLRTVFSPNPAFLARLQGMRGTEATAEGAAADCGKRYSALPRPWSFCLLGLGSDGHTASLFPGATGLQQALAGSHLCQAISAQPSIVTGAHTERLSLTLAGLLQAQRLFLYFTGHAKWRVYQAALHCDDPSVLPLAAVLRQTVVPVHVFYHP